MSQKSLPILLLLVVLLGGGIYWLSRTGGGTEPAASSIALMAGLGGPPDELHLVSADKLKEYRLAEGSLGWNIVYPIEDEANLALVHLWLSQLGSAQKARAFPDGDPPAELIAETEVGEHGKLTVKRGAQSIAIEFGQETFPPGKIFARVNGTIFKVDLGIEQALETNLHDLRNPLLFRTDGAGLQELSIRRHEDGTTIDLVLRRDPSNRFVVRTPSGEELPAHPQHVSELLAHLLAARARGFDSNIDPIGTQPWLEIRVVGQFGAEHVTITRAPRGGVVAHKTERPNVRFLLEEEAFTRLVEYPVTRLIDTSLWTFGPSSAQRIQIDDDDPKSPSLTLEKRADNPSFRIAAPDERPAESREVNALIATLERTHLVKALAGEQLEAARKALATPGVTIRLTSPADRRLPDIEVALVRAGDEVYGRRNDEPTIYRVSCPDFARFHLPWYAYASLDAFRLGGARTPTEVHVASAGRERLYARGPNGAWMLGDKNVDEEFEDPFDVLTALGAAEVLGDDAARLLAGKTKLATVDYRAPAAGGGVRSLATLHLYDVGADGDGGDAVLSHTEGDRLVYRVKTSHARRLRLFLAE